MMGSRHLPARDMVLLPLISALTIILMLGAAEALARVFWPQQLHDKCELHDPRLGSVFKPNCSSRIKTAEGPWVTNHYNNCGYRTEESCGPKAPGQLRVAVLGTSISRGYLVPYQDTFAARATRELERRCRRPIDFQNLAGGGTGSLSLDNLYLRIPSALALKPDVLVLTLAPFDLEEMRPPPSARSAEPQAKDWLRWRLTAQLMRLDSALRSESRAFLVAQHLLYQNLDSYLPLFLKHGDEADYLRPPFTPAWQQRFRQLDTDLGQVADRIRAARVPLLVVFVPLRAQAALVKWPALPPGVDPHAIGRAIGAIAAKHGLLYSDLTDTIAARPNPADLYYPVDTHPTSAGHKVIAQAVVSALLHDIPALGPCEEVQAADYRRSPR